MHFGLKSCGFDFWKNKVADGAKNYCMSENNPYQRLVEKMLKQTLKNGSMEKKKIHSVKDDRFRDRHDKEEKF